MDTIEKGRFYILSDSNTDDKFWAFIKDIDIEGFNYFCFSDNVWKEKVSKSLDFAVEVENIEVVPIHFFSKQQKRMVVKSII